MMLSRTSEYALRALAYLATHIDLWPISGPHIAIEAGVPRKYLSVILADLVRVGLLEGTRGKRGGFKLTRKAGKIKLAEVVAPFEPLDAERTTCPFGNTICSDKNPCAAHHQWKEVKAVAARFLEQTTLESIVLKRAARKAGGGLTRSAR